MNQVKVFVTEGQTEERTDKLMSINVSHFRERWGTTRKL